MMNNYDWFGLIENGDWIKFRYYEDVGHYTEDIREEVRLIEVAEIHSVVKNGKLDLEESKIIGKKDLGCFYTEVSLMDIIEIIEIRVKE